MKKIPFISCSVAHTGHLFWRLKLFWTKADCTKTLVQDLEGHGVSIPVVLGPKAADEGAEGVGLCGSPPPAGVHVHAGWRCALRVVHRFFSSFLKLSWKSWRYFPQRICFSSWISRRVTNIVQFVFRVKYRSAQPGSLAEETFLLIPLDVLTSSPHWIHKMQENSKKG